MIDKLFLNVNCDDSKYTSYKSIKELYNIPFGILKCKLFYSYGFIDSLNNVDDDILINSNAYFEEFSQHNSATISTILYNKSFDILKKLRNTGSVLDVYELDPKHNRNREEISCRQMYCINDDEKFKEHIISKQRGWDQTSHTDEDKFFINGYFIYTDKKEYVKALLTNDVEIFHSSF